MISTATARGVTMLGKARGETASCSGVCLDVPAGAAAPPLQTMGRSAVDVTISPAAKISEPLLMLQAPSMKAPRNTARNSEMKASPVARRAMLMRVFCSMSAVSRTNTGMRPIGPIMLNSSGNSFPAACARVIVSSMVKAPSTG